MRAKGPKCQLAYWVVRSSPVNATKDIRYLQVKKKIKREAYLENSWQMKETGNCPESSCPDTPRNYQLWQLGCFLKASPSRAQKS